MTWLGNEVDRMFRSCERRKIILCPKAELFLLMAKDCQQLKERPDVILPYRGSLSLASENDKKMLQLINDWIRD